jgi:hypothetical protein
LAFPDAQVDTVRRKAPGRGERVALRLEESTRRAVDHRQRPERVALNVANAHARIEMDVGLARHQRITCKAQVGHRVLNDKNVVLRKT